MEIVVHFESSVRRSRVALHAWEPQGEVWDRLSRGQDGALFTFHLRGAAADQRAIQFKFRFPDERRWESDALTRTVPTRTDRVFWAFDDSPRVMTRDPSVGAAPARIAVGLVTRSWLAGGTLYAWQAGGAESARFAETSRDDARGVSSFDLALDQPDGRLAWMKRGFHFKFVDREGRFETDACNRVWRPADGGTVSVKSGQAALWAGPPAARQVTVTLLGPRGMAPPALKLVDLSGDSYQGLVAPSSTRGPAAQDERFSRSDYLLDVFPEAPYAVELADPSLEGALSRPLRVAADETGAALHKVAIVGDARWLAAEPVRAPVALVFHPRGWTGPIGRLDFDLAVGSAPAFARVPARRQPDGSWRAETEAPVGVVLQARPSADRPIDRRVDGPVHTARQFELRAPGAVELHTVDAQSGFVSRAAAPAGAGGAAVAP